jgi:ABC-type spermidine/putrescine transport system permease subunit II
MSSIIIGLYFLIILIFLAFGAAIVFHLLRYRINRRVAGIMSLIYIIGTVLLLISNFILFSQVDWEQLFGNFRL